MFNELSQLTGLEVKANPVILKAINPNIQNALVSALGSYLKQSTAGANTLALKGYYKFNNNHHFSVATYNDQSNFASDYQMHEVSIAGNLSKVDINTIALHVNKLIDPKSLLIGEAPIKDAISFASEDGSSRVPVNKANRTQLVTAKQLENDLQFTSRLFQEVSYTVTESGSKDDVLNIIDLVITADGECRIHVGYKNNKDDLFFIYQYDGQDLEVLSSSELVDENTSMESLAPVVLAKNLSRTFTLLPKIKKLEIEVDEEPDERDSQALEHLKSNMHKLGYKAASELNTYIEKILAENGDDAAAYQEKGGDSAIPSKWLIHKGQVGLMWNVGWDVEHGVVTIVYPEAKSGPTGDIVR